MARDWSDEAAFAQNSLVAPGSSSLESMSSGMSYSVENPPSQETPAAEVRNGKQKEK